MSNSNPTRPDTGQALPTESSNTSKSAPLPAKRRRRWLRWFAGGLFTLIVILAVVVGFLPQMASTPALRNYIFSMVNDRLRGTLQVDALALSWGGPLEVRGLTVLDPEKKVVIQVQRITTNGGLWSLLTSGMAFGEIVVDSPNIVVKQTGSGELTLTQAFLPRPPAPAETRSELALPSPVGRLIVKAGTLTVERPAAAAYEIKELNGRVDINTLNKMTADVNCTTPDGARLSGTADIRDLLAGGQLKPDHANGELRIASDRSVTVGPLAALLGQPGLKGGVKVECDAKIDAGKLQGRFTFGLSELQSAQRAAASAKPIDAQLQGNLAWADNKLTASLDLSGDMGQARADLQYQHTDKAIKIGSDQIVSAILTGQSLALPDFSLKAQAHIDLARLGQTVPELLKVREGVALTGGQLEITGLTIDGGATPVASATIELKDLAARRSDNSNLRLEPISLKFDSTLAQGQGLQVKQLDLAASFAAVHASGSAADMQATFNSDLDRLQREIGQVIDLGAYNLAGSMNGSVDLKRVNDEQVNVGLQLSAEKLLFSGSGRSLELPRAGVSQTGQLLFANQKLAKIVVQASPMWE